MEKLIVHGGNPLNGTVRVSGAKNAVLPIIVASMLGVGKSTLTEIPELADVHTVSEVIKSLGVAVESPEKGTLVLDGTNITSTVAPYDLVRRMRASFLVMGPLLARKRHAKISLPGGCSIGARPIDLHLKAFEAMGAVIDLADGDIEASVPDGLKGARIYLDFPSVGATENILLLSVKAEGTTVIHNVAREPEIVALARFLRACGAEIYGEGTPTIMVEGVRKLHGAVFEVPFDRIEAGTFLCAAAMTGGKLYLHRAEKQYMEQTLEVLEKAGCGLRYEEDAVYLQAPTRLLSDFTLATGPYPAFPTDMQPMVMSLLTLAKGTCMMSETVFEARFRHVAELCRMGANIQVHGRNAAVFGVEKLHGAKVKATDLRSGAALLLAALAAEGETIVEGSAFVERGYEKLEDALTFLGGRVQLVS